MSGGSKTETSRICASSQHTGNVALITPPVLGTINGGFTGFNERLIIPLTSVNQIWNTATGLGRVAVSFSFASTQSGTCDGAWIGWQGGGSNVYNFDGNQVALTFKGGALSFAQVGNAAPVVSDYVHFTAIYDKKLIVSTHWSGTTDTGVANSTFGAGTNQNLSGATQVSVTRPTGTWANDSFWTFVSNIQFVY